MSVMFMPQSARAEVATSSDRLDAIGKICQGPKLVAAQGPGRPPVQFAMRLSPGLLLSASTHNDEPSRLGDVSVMLSYVKSHVNMGN
jgi:hypothetical protein